jgi:hypothetical protein
VKKLSAMAIGVALTVGGLSVTSSAWAVGTWSGSTTDISALVEETYTNDLQLVSAPDGTMVAMWSEDDTGVGVSLKAKVLTDIGWSVSPASVSESAPAINEFQLVSRPDSSFVAIWSEEDPDNGDLSNVRASVLVNDSWSPALLLANPGEDVGRLTLASAPNGTVVAAWERGYYVEASVLSASGWSETKDLGEGSDPQVAAAPNSALAVTWNAGDRSIPTPAAIIYSGTTWSDPVSLSSTTGLPPLLAASPTGLVAIWTEGGSDRFPRASTFNGTVWSPTFDLSDDSSSGAGSSGQVVATRDQTGTPTGTVVTWFDGSPVSGSVWTRTFNGTTWSEPFELADASQVAINHQVVAAPNGTLVAAWQKNGGGPLIVRTFADSAWSAPFELASDLARLPQLASAANGYFVATWQEKLSGVPTTVASTFDGTGWSTPATVLATGTASPRVASRANNEFVVAWSWTPPDFDGDIIQATTAATPAATPATAPAQVTGLTAAAANGSATLTWTAPSNGGTSITDYIIEKNDGTSGWSTVTDGVSTGTSHTVTGLTNGIGYQFRISAVNATGTGATSTASATVTPTATATAPAQPGASGDGRLATTGAAPIVGIGGLAAALVLLVGGGLLVATRRRNALSAE